jgi:peptidoglycan/LPS O-acetylase OafA/YrhL
MNPTVELLAEPAPPSTLHSPPPAPRDARLPHEKPAADAGEPVWLWQGQVPCLNGLRALSILVVIVAHLSGKASTSFPLPHLSGAIGVEMFFVISGFLITLLLLREHRRQGTVSVRGFFLRRVFRIVPAYAFYLLVLLGLQLAGVIHVPVESWARAVTYTTSLFEFRSGGLDLHHTWSLSVEEHFYLLWPCLMLLLGIRKSMLAAGLCIVLTPFLRFTLQHGLGESHPNFSFFTPTRMDAIAVGCCLAYLATSPGFRRATGLATKWSTVAAAAGVALVVGVALLSWAARVPALADAAKSFCSLEPFLASTLKPILLAWIVWTCVRTPYSLVGRILNCKILNYLGILSYSLYLWQQLFLQPERSHWTCDWPYNIVFALVAAVISYVLIERPFLALKERLSLAAPSGPPMVLHSPRRGVSGLSPE